MCLLVTEGKEEKNLKESMAAKEYTNKKLVTHPDVVDSLCESPRLVPTEFNPKCVQTFIKTSAENQPTEMGKPNDVVRVSRRQKPKKLVNFVNKIFLTIAQQPMASQKRSTQQQPASSIDLRNFFLPITNGTTASRQLRQPSTKQSLQPSIIPAVSKEDVSDRLKVPTLWEILEDTRTSTVLKAYAVRNNVAVWKDKFVAKTLSPVYETAIMSAINDPECVSKLVNGIEVRSKCPVAFVPEFDSHNEPYDPLFAAKLRERFSVACKMEELNESSSLISESIVQKSVTELINFCDAPSQDFIPFYDEIESKYEKVNTSHGTSKLFDFSSPVAPKRAPLKSSTPLTSRKAVNRSMGSIKNSPLARAFERCKSMNESKAKPMRVKREPKVTTLTEALAFLGLNDVMDIFSDSTDDIKMDRHSAESLESNREKIEMPSTSHVNRSSQGYTVSQILQIVNSGQQNFDEGGASVMNDSATMNRSVAKEIYVGTIEDIFGSDDESVIDNTLPVDKPSAIKDGEYEEEDVIASSQPVISEIKLPSKVLSSTENQIPLNYAKEPSNCDDMFASFSTTNSPIPSHSNEVRPNVNDSHAPLINNTKSPSPSPSLLITVERSPSLFRSQSSVSRLKALTLKSNSERLVSNSLPNRPPTFSGRSLDVQFNNNRNRRQELSSTAEPNDKFSQIGELITLIFI